MRKREMERILTLISLFLLYVALAVQVVSFSFGHSLCSSHDSIALLQFKHSLAVADYPLLNYYDFFCPYSYPKTTSWNRSSMDCCRWDGVTCDRFTGHVIGLDLSCSKLEGTIHPNSSLFQLRHLQTLDLSLNNFSLSHIPRGIGQLVSLMHLNLSYSMFEGGIPLEISHLSNLVSLDLSYLFSLQFSQEGFNMLFRNLTKLEVLSLSFVNISSKIPMNVSSSSSLRYLDLGKTGLHGNLPKSIFLLPNLETLRLSGNLDLTVSFPKFNWSSSHTLTELDLSRNNISGGLPGTLGSLKALKLMKLHWCNLVGPIPESIRNLSQITELDLSYNHLESKIPDAFSDLQKLTFLALDGNTFSGLFPSSLVNLTKLEDLRLSNNSLNGPLPLTANGLQNLYRLVLSNNSLNGSIPSWMLSLPSLTELHLESNHLSGPLPEFKPNSIEWLDLSQNQLCGSIPQSLRNLVNLSDLNLGQNKLVGEVGAEMFSSMTNLRYLDLSSNNLSGEVGAEMFFSVTDLIRLDLSHSGLSWSSSKDNITILALSYLSLGSCRVKDFPNFFLNSTSLKYLDLSENEIHGHFPKWFDGLSSMRFLNLSHNYLTSLDHLPWQTMTVVDLQSNSLTGPLPSSLCTSTYLSFLDLSYNNLSAEIPNCLLTSFYLTVLDLRANNFYGPIPNKFSNFCGLVHISLSKNQLEGPIPRSLVNCASLKVLDLGYNKIHDPFPTWLETLQELEVLILKSNRFYGSIVAIQTKSPFPNLRIFDLSGNSLTGPLPTRLLKGFKAMVNMDTHKSKLEYFEEDIGYVNRAKHAEILEYRSPPSAGASDATYEESVDLVMKNQETKFRKILKIFTTVDLSMNKFEGEIPKSIGNLNSLLLLNLSHNNLTGHIPVEMKKMGTLEALDLSFNQLTGKIPEELTSLTFLAVLNLSHNHLVGPIPHSNQFNTFPNDSYFGNSDLCGFPLSTECGHRKSASVPGLLVEQEEDEPSFLSEMTWKSVLIGYGCGLIFGFTVLYLIYCFERPRWFVDFFATITHELTYRTKRRGQRRRNFHRRRH
ncbi:uncharacterized protein LOC107785811 [Nicotiana tabacum]|uniref:Uncharacterized protein LOC107785811 n=1 Tax=Nicotiana tabacum TaxID=4097 RepID=A0A1S3ZEF8_TOBAC